MKDAREYNIEIKAKVQDEIIDTKFIKIKVLDRILEFIKTGQNQELLNFIANESKGEMINFDQIGQIVNSINSKSQISYEDMELDFYIHELIFALLLFLLTFEWTTRKYFGYL